MKVNFENCSIEIEGRNLLGSVTHNDIIKSLRGEKDYVISKINVFFLRGQAFFPFNNKKEEKHFYLD